MITFSLDGNVIVYGLESGDVYEFCYKTRRCTHVITLTASISYLKYFEDGNCGILVAASENGDYVVREGETTIMRSLSTSDYTGLMIVFCIYLQDLRSFLVINKKRTITVWDVQGKKEMLLLPGKSHLNVVSCALSSSGKRFLCVFKNGNFEMYRLVFTTNIDIELEQGKKLADGSLECCCFSFDEKLVAFGKENGDIMVSS